MVPAAPSDLNMNPLPDHWLASTNLVVAAVEDRVTVVRSLAAL
jgi:hypothetical protein